MTNKILVNDLAAHMHRSINSVRGKMSTQDALALANHLATTLPRDDQSYDAYMADAFARWPTLSETEIGWAIQRAAAMSRREGNRLYMEADEAERGRSGESFPEG
jgi:hypothetical protein